MLKSAKIMQAIELLRDAGLTAIKFDSGATAIVIVEMSPKEFAHLQNEPELAQHGGFVTANHCHEVYQTSALLSIAVKLT